MEEKEIREKYGISKKMGIAIFCQMLLVVAALVISIIGIVRIPNPSRLIVYVCQAVVCVLILLFGFIHFKDRDRRYLKFILYAYAALEALRVALIVTIGVSQIYGAIAKFLLVATACVSVLVAERMDTRNVDKFAVAMLILEIALYLVFIIGFPGVMLGTINRFLPLVGVFIAGSVVLFIQAKNQQLAE